MTPATIIREAQSDGVRLALSPTGSIKATGAGTAVNRWLAVIREHKAEIIDVLERHPDAIAAEPFTPTIRQPSSPLRSNDETAIRAWLACIEETDPATIAEVIDRCRRDTEARDYFTERAAAELPKTDAFPDERRPCDQCANLRQRSCSIAEPKAGALVVANRGYRPDPARLLRCAGYQPLASDSDQRPGRERWPGLIVTQ